MVKIPSGLQVMQREDLISAWTITRNKAHIPGPSVGVSNSKRQCCWRRWRHWRRNWAFHFSSEGHYTTLFPSTCTSTWSSWSSNRKGWIDVWHAKLPYATLLIERLGGSFVIHVLQFYSSGSISTWKVVVRFFAKFFGFLFDNMSWCYLVFASLFPTL